MKPRNLNERRAIEAYRDKGYICMKNSTLKYWKNKLHRQRRASERVQCSALCNDVECPFYTDDSPCAAAEGCGGFVERYLEGESY